MADFLEIREILLAFLGESRIFMRVHGGQIMTTKRAKSFYHRKEVFRNLLETLGHSLRQNEKLAAHTSFGIGGEAEFFFVAKRPEDLIKAIHVAREVRMPFLILGGGSNVLVSDSGVRGLVIKNKCDKMLLSNERIICQSGAKWDGFVSLGLENSLSGMEFVAGIPGTIGGAVYGNSGAFGKSVGDLLTEAVILNSEGSIKRVQKDYFEFGYRESRLKKAKDVVLSATFELKKGEKKKIRQEVQRNIEERKKRVPLKDKSAGCFFKNVVGNGKNVSAGFLLDQVGAKNMQRGEARVFKNHANILINKGKATAKDVRALANFLKRKVKQEFGVDLEEEVVYLS